MRSVVAYVVILFLAGSAQADSVAFFYALDADLAALKMEARPVGQSVAIGTRRIQRLALGPHTIYAVKMGSGCVETALSAQALLTRFRCDWAFSVGPAGALSDELEIGKWYRVSSVIAWQRSPALSHWAANWSQFPDSIRFNATLGTNDIRLASGELFISTNEERSRVRLSFDTVAVDMNAFGLVAACTDHNVPLFMWKIISDRADESAVSDFRHFLGVYRGAGGAALVALLTSLPPNPNDPATYPNVRAYINIETETLLPSPPPPEMTATNGTNFRE